VFYIKNNQQRKIEKHEVDDGLIKGEKSKKCDWLAVDVESGKEIYIELKGKNIEHAIEQLCISVEKLSPNKSSKKLAYAMLTRRPKTSQKIKNIKKSVLKSHKIVLEVKTIEHTETIEKLIAYLAS
jgi:hypothetical protein